jgi:hypothetical protein
LVSSNDFLIPSDIVGSVFCSVACKSTALPGFVTADVDCVDHESGLSPEPDDHYFLE